MPLTFVQTEAEMSPFLEMHGISKTFPGVKALSHVDLRLQAGEVHVIAGENGAGKSTLMKILTGVFHADPGGTIQVEGDDVMIKDPVGRDVGRPLDSRIRGNDSDRFGLIGYHSIGGTRRPSTLIAVVQRYFV